MNQDWRGIVRSCNSLLARALKMEERDPETAEILRYFAEVKALTICEVVPGTLAEARRALVAVPNRKHGFKGGPSWLFRSTSMAR